VHDLTIVFRSQVAEDVVVLLEPETTINITPITMSYTTAINSYKNNKN